MTAKQIKENEADEAIERHRALVNSESKFADLGKEAALKVGTYSGRMSCAKANLSRG